MDLVPSHRKWTHGPWFARCVTRITAEPLGILETLRQLILGNPGQCIAERQGNCLNA